MNLDNTIKGAAEAIDEVMKEEAGDPSCAYSYQAIDDYFVVVLSDANIAQYSITPEVITKSKLKLQV